MKRNRWKLYALYAALAVLWLLTMLEWCLAPFGWNEWNGDKEQKNVLD